MSGGVCSRSNLGLVEAQKGGHFELHVREVDHVAQLREPSLSVPIEPQRVLAPSLEGSDSGADPHAKDIRHPPPVRSRFHFGESCPCGVEVSKPKGRTSGNEIDREAMRAGWRVGRDLVVGVLESTGNMQDDRADHSMPARELGVS